MFTNCIKLIIFFSSLAGESIYIKNKTGIEWVFIPGYTALLNIFLLFFAGIFNVLEIISFILYISGIILFIYYALKIKRYIKLEEFKKNMIIWFAVFLLVSSLIAVYSKEFIHWDNFTHWAIVIKQMLLENRFPNYRDVLISYNSYPLGSASWVYFFSKFTSSAESMQMFAQCTLMIFLLLPLVKYIKKGDIFGLINSLIIANIILTININIFNMLVDTLLPIAGVFLTLYAYHNKRNNKAYIIPILTSVLLIKNSAFFYTVPAIIILLTDKDLSIKSKVKTIIIPFLCLFIWKRHCSYVFNNAVSSPHSMSVSNYLAQFHEKTTDDIWRIIHTSIDAYFDGRHFPIIFFMAILAFVLFILLKSNQKEYIQTMILCITLYISYGIGMILMYIFSMPNSETYDLGGLQDIEHPL